MRSSKLSGKVQVVLVAYYLLSRQIFLTIYAYLGMLCMEYEGQKISKCFSSESCLYIISEDYWPLFIKFFSILSPHRWNIFLNMAQQITMTAIVKQQGPNLWYLSANVDNFAYFQPSPEIVEPLAELSNPISSAPRNIGTMIQCTTTPISNRFTATLLKECPILIGLLPYLMRTHLVVQNRTSMLIRANRTTIGKEQQQTSANKTITIILAQMYSICRSAPSRAWLAPQMVFSLSALLRCMAKLKKDSAKWNRLDTLNEVELMMMIKNVTYLYQSREKSEQVWMDTGSKLVQLNSLRMMGCSIWYSDKYEYFQSTGLRQSTRCSRLITVKQKKVRMQVWDLMREISVGCLRKWTKWVSSFIRVFLQMKTISGVAIISSASLPWLIQETYRELVYVEPERIRPVAGQIVVSFQEQQQAQPIEAVSNTSRMKMRMIPSIVKRPITTKTSKALAQQFILDMPIFSQAMASGSTWQGLKSQ